MMEAGVGASVACYRDTFAKGLRDGLTETITHYNPQKANFDFAQTKVLNYYCYNFILVLKKTVVVC